MIDLTHIDLATEEDKANKIDQWATFFKATTWEVLKMLAKEIEIAKKNTEIAEKDKLIQKLQEQLLKRKDPT